MVTTSADEPGFYYDDSGTRVNVTDGIKVRSITGLDPSDPSDIGSMVQSSFIQGYQYTGEDPVTTQTIDRDSYESAVDKLAENGIASINGVTVAGAGMIGDVSGTANLNPEISRTNNYAANSMEFHVSLLDILPSLTSEVDAAGVALL